ncbi:MAG: hypothetical protein JRK53_24945 [Deltaproteobacteria bacterium]|nr:hypothetical protein [Deltaproteobacteria bacterium]
MKKIKKLYFTAFVLATFILLTGVAVADDVEVELQNAGDAFKVTQGGADRLKSTGNGDVTINNSYTLPGADGTNGQVMTTDGGGTASWQDASVDTDDQKIDKFNLSGNTLELSLEDDGEADKTVDLSTVNPNTASSLAADGSNCPAGQYARGIDASGNAQDCTADNIAGDSDWTILVNDMYNNNSGNVGIGTSSPGSKLEIYGNGNPNAQVRLKDVSSGNTAVASLYAYDNSDNVMWWVGDEWTGDDNIALTNHRAANIYFRTDNKNRVTIDASGKVGIGIGTNSPDAILHVEQSGSARSDGTFRFIQPNLSSGNDNSILFGRKGAAGEGGLLGYSYNSTTSESVIFLNHWDDSTGLGSGFALKKGGNVGIGTPDPQAPGTGSRSLVLNGANFPMYILRAANATAHNKIWRFIARGDGSNISQIQTLDDSYAGEVTAMEMKRSGTSIDYVKFPNGNVGIGNPTPGYKLDVNGDINTTGEIRKNGTAYNNPDYVFEPGYALMPLEDLADFVAEAKHLPGMPSSEKVKKDGVRLFEQNRLMLEKLEEAYLYIIELQNRIEKLENAVGSAAISSTFKKP